MKTKTRGAPTGTISWKSFASAIEHCNSVDDAVVVLERMLEAARAAPGPQNLRSNLGHFTDWLEEVRVRRGGLGASTHAKVVAVFAALSAVSSVPPDPPDVARLHECLQAMSRS